MPRSRTFRRLLAPAAALLAASAALPAATQPNILTIVMDDLGYAQLDFALDALTPAQLAALDTAPQSRRYAAAPAALLAAARDAMPNIAALARSGVRMTRAYVPSPICGPSRAALLTGRQPQSLGIYGNNDSDAGVPLGIPLLPALLRDTGYRTAAIGKWHIAATTRSTIPEADRTRDYHDNEIRRPLPGHEPTERGVDYFYGYHASGAALWNSPAIFRNTRGTPAPGYLTHHLVDETLRFIDGAARARRPFYINLAFSVPHSPLETPSPDIYMRRFNTGNPEADKYYAALSAADDGIGRILEKLRSQNALANTLVIFISDNGAVAESPLPQNAPFRGHKGRYHEGGVRIPFIASWPGRIPSAPAARTDATLISTLDIFPTVLAAAGIARPPGLSLDGQNILPLLENRAPHPAPQRHLYWAGPDSLHWSAPNEIFWHAYWRYITYQTRDAPRSRYLEKNSPFAAAIRDQRWSLHLSDDNTTARLYDLDADPAETTDLSAARPEVAARLRRALELWLSAQPPPLVGAAAPSRKL